MIGGISVCHLIVLPEKVCRLRYAVFICRCERNRMNQTAACVHANMEFYSKFPLIPLFCLGHFQVAGFGCILVELGH